MTDRSRRAVTFTAYAVAAACALASRRAHADPAAEDTPGGTAAPGEPAPAAASPPAASPLPAPPSTVPAERPASPPPSPSPSWFARAPLTLAIGQGSGRWAVTFYGFIEADYITDSTRSYNDAIGANLVARDDTYEGRVGRTQFSMRNTRLGLLFESPALGGIHPSALLEADFFGNQPGSPPDVSEASYFGNPALRIRHAYLKLQGGLVDVLAGQTYDVFGWQNYFSPCSVEFLGLPNQVFSRSTQLRLGRTFGAGGPISLDVAVSAARPAQRDSTVPDLQAGIRLGVNGWKGITTPGNVGTIVSPLSVGVSGVSRQFKVDAFAPPPPQRSNHISGWGVSVDALVPVIPAASADDRGNRLTLIGSFVMGTGIADLITAGGGARFPTLQNPGQATPPPVYSPDIDNGLVTFDLLGVLHTIDWQAYKVGLQYYLPPTGRVILSLNYTHAHSKNLRQLFPQGGAEIELLGSVADTTRYADMNVFWDATPAVRFGVSGQYTEVQYLGVDGNKPHNLRGMGQATYVF
jgi:hypothetical protein